MWFVYIKSGGFTACIKDLLKGKRECFNKLSAHLAVPHPDVTQPSVLTTHYCIIRTTVAIKLYCIFGACLKIKTALRFASCYIFLSLYMPSHTIFSVHTLGGT